MCFQLKFLATIDVGASDGTEISEVNNMSNKRVRKPLRDSLVTALPVCGGDSALLLFEVSWTFLLNACRIDGDIIFS